MIHAKCEGGPMNGQEYDGEGGKGVVFVDKPAGDVHVYDWTGTAYVYVRSDRIRDKKLEKAVADPDRDVRSLPVVSDG